MCWWELRCWTWSTLPLAKHVLFEDQDLTSVSVYSFFAVIIMTGAEMPLTWLHVENL